MGSGVVGVRFSKQEVEVVKPDLRWGFVIKDDGVFLTPPRIALLFDPPSRGGCTH